MIESGWDWTQFSTENLGYSVYETVMILIREVIEMLEIQDNDLVRMWGEPIGYVKKRLVDFRPVQTMKEVYIGGSWLRGNAQI